MARDALIAQGQHPSLDAIRIALGNTGSRTTIHRYLKGTGSSTCRTLA
ncbi:DNA-binding protein [Paraburkholderia caffeinilytica]